MARVDRQLVAVLGDLAQFVDVVDPQFRVDPLGEEVQGDVHHVHVAGALAVAEQRALDAVGPGQDTQLRRRHAGAPVVVGVQGQDDAVPVAHIPVKPFNLVGIDVGGGHLHCGRQV